jgi:predicted esterase
VIARTIPVTTHGRYLVRPPAENSTGSPLLVGCHGYAESAEQMMPRLASTPGSERWCVAAVQGLNRFYQRRTDEVIAGWMTRQDRELVIADNIAYMHAAVDAVTTEWRGTGPLVYAGFSQGTSMAFRAAAASRRRVSAVFAVGGDVPPEISDDALRTCGRVWLCRGRGDEWYTDAKLAADVERLRRAGVEPHVTVFDGGHEWTEAVVAAAAACLVEAAR